MRIGILADLHESLTNLGWAINVLQEQGADRLVVLFYGQTSEVQAPTMTVP
jgi:hypothetical protein